eukprot:TRINITY_DN9279_c0_g1_i1.p1 TRINITY_DN9279_c0_g1~~TRINITY_DN9279_c0_g1_i1.p1  ORF type:complete len:110 (-),score=30.66 TRINITY_DN9279_c0_g1_i1:167-496(-)
MLRAQGAFNLFREFIVLNGLTDAIIKKLKGNSRVEFLLSLYTTRTEDLTKMFESNLFPAVATEEQRIKETPYMTQEHLLALLKFRKNKEGDHAAEKFLRDKLGFFQSLF